ncbi:MULTISPECIES: hypothetical protein [Streptococcus]|uniref:hypothetical protein n=1 Tax=Streptococcus TaxID=1301 RepID=UPI00232D9EC4|nr:MULTISPECIES: hypothetical protein [Streptococcus]MDY5636244.1 hypothetical protein [Streptococcus orisratti]
MKKIFYLYNQIKNDKKKLLASKLFFRELIFELFNCDSQEEFEKIPLTDDDVKMLLEKLDEKFITIFSTKEMLDIINSKLYYPCVLDEIYSKQKNAITYESFLDIYREKCKDYGISDDFYKIINGAGHPTIKYNIVFWDLFIDFVINESQKYKKVKNGVRIKNLALLRKELEATIDNKQKYFDIVKSQLDSIEIEYYNDLEKLYNLMFSYVGRAFELYDLLNDEFNQKITEEMDIYLDFVKLMTHEFINLFISKTVSIFEDANLAEQQIAVNYYRDVFTDWTLFFEDFRPLEMQETMTSFRERYKKLYIENPDLRIIPATKSSSIYYFMIVKERLLKTLQEDIDLDYVNVNNHIQRLKDLSTRYVERKIKLTSDTERELYSIYHIQFRSTLLKYIQSKFEKYSSNDLEFQRLKEQLIDRKWLYL